MKIPSSLLTVGTGALAAGAGVGAVALAAKVTGDETGNRRMVSGILAGVGTAAGAGALLARNTRAFGPLLGAGVGLAAAGIIDAVRAGGSTPPPATNIEQPRPEPRPRPRPRDDDRRASLKPGDLLPDGVQAAPTELYRDGADIRFDSVVGNQGAAALQLALHFNQRAGTSRTTQVIFNQDGTATERDLQGGLRLDERRDHSHLHFDDFVYFQLFEADRNGQPKLGSEIAGGVKQSFYITDIDSFDVADPKNRELAGSLGAKGQVDRDIVKADVVQGISVGMADIYGAELEGQSFSVPDIEPGRYVLRQTFDPSDEVLEQDERNNVADTLFKVRPDGEVRTIRSEFAPRADYRRQADGRIVIPSVVASLEHNRTPHGHEAGAEH